MSREPRDPSGPGLPAYQKGFPVQVVYATSNTSVTTEGAVHVMIRAGEHWPANDPVVLAHPSLFTDDPKIGLRISVPLVEETAEPTTPADAPLADADTLADPAAATDEAAVSTDAPVEQATKAPGEKRTTKRA